MNTGKATSYQMSRLFTQSLSLIIGIEIVEGEQKRPLPQKAQEIKRQMVDKGFLFDILGSSSIRLTPPLIVEKEHIDPFIDTLGSVLKEMS